MKLIRFGRTRQERWGVLDDEGIPRAFPISHFREPREALSTDEIDALRRFDVRSLPQIPVDARLGPPLVGCGKIVCIGLNYRDHATEAGMEVPKEPVMFMKATSAITGPYDNVVMPIGGTKLDWEVELGVVIGRHGSHVAEARARDHVAGFCTLNDVSERAFQLEGTGQWVKGKSADSFAPIGPWLVTTDEVHDPQNLDIWLKVNGQFRQQSSTRYMIFGVYALVSYVSRFMSLHPGDVIATGTPPGVGLGMSPPTYLRIGDVITLGVGDLGLQQQTVVGPAIAGG